MTSFVVLIQQNAMKVAPNAAAQVWRDASNVVLDMKKRTRDAEVT